jgi:hypothetical protein
MARTTFVNIKPEGFAIKDDLFHTLSFVVSGEALARKLWSRSQHQRTLLCFSSNGRTNRQGRPCRSCPQKQQCLLKLRIYFFKSEQQCCLELPDSSYRNYRQYTKNLLEMGLDVRKVITIARTIDRGYWAEVRFAYSKSLHLTDSIRKNNRD